KVKIITSEKVGKEKGLGVLRERESIVMPTVAIVCPKCKNNEAYFYSAQTRAGDEAETQFFRCTKCQHNWRKYS
ncbi:MAG: zinc ribbon domain-containing protein, partial [Nanoarchaeota archaeon]